MNKLVMIPNHIAIIMDGNRRWARQRGLPVLAGHKFVADKILEPLVEHAAKRGVKYITFWAWSTENWQRTKQEVFGVMKLFKHVIARKWQRLHKMGVCIKAIGDLSKFNQDIRQSLEKVVEQTKNNKKITAVFALNYGGRDELLRAFKKLINEIRNTKYETRNLNAQIISDYLDTADIPDPDLIIRTGGERRLSGFMLWQAEYSELYFADFLMPEFTPQKLDEILADYNQRQRRKIIMDGLMIMLIAAMVFMVGFAYFIIREDKK